MTVSITFRPISTCFTAIISRRSPARVHWSVRCLRRKWVICRVRSGFLLARCLPGAVQDMTVLFLSTRRDGRSLGDIVRAEMGPVAGTITGIGILLICVIVLAVLALVVVKALIGSPWGTFAVFCTIPIALLMGVYNQFIRPGRIGEMSLLGCVLLLAALTYGKTVSETPCARRLFRSQRGDTRADHHRIRFRRIRAAGLVASGSARLSFDIPENRYHRAAGHRHHHRSSRSPDAGRSPSSSTAADLFGLAACSRSCSLPSRAVLFPDGIRSLRQEQHRR